jgi:alpha-1,2-mannosyltransferase
MIIWLLNGPLNTRLGARLLGWGWLALTLVGVPWLLSFAQPTIWQIGRPWYLAWAGLIYIAAALATLAWIAATGRPEAVRPESDRVAGPAARPCP